VGLAVTAAHSDVFAPDIGLHSPAVGAAADQLPGRAVAPAQGEEAGLGAVALPLAGGPGPDPPVEIVHPEGAAAAGVEAIGDQRPSDAGGADRGFVGLAVLVGEVVRALAGPLELELGAEPLALGLAELLRLGPDEVGGGD